MKRHAAESAERIIDLILQDFDAVRPQGCRAGFELLVVKGTDP